MAKRLITKIVGHWRNITETLLMLWGSSWDRLVQLAASITDSEFLIQNIGCLVGISMLIMPHIDTVTLLMTVC